MHAASTSTSIKIINLTPHPIRLRTSDGAETEVPPSGTIARVASRPAWAAREVPGLPVPVQGAPQWGAVEGLPAPQEGAVYLVSSLVLEAVRASGAHRPDVMAPATGPQDGAVRDDAGRIVAVTRLVAAAEPTAADEYVEEHTSASNSPHAARYTVRVPRGVQLPARGDWRRAESGRTTVYTFAPDDTQPLAFMLGGELRDTCSGGVETAAVMGGDHVGVITIGWCAPGTVVRACTGYKLRSERHLRFGVGRIDEVAAADAVGGAGESLGATLGERLAALRG